MADPICRWRNSSIKQLMEFNSLFPFKTISRKEGRKHVERLWKILGGEDFFTTPYQLAAQMGTFYEDNDLLYPRFDRLITIEEAAEYMQKWGSCYYSPNPYTKSIKDVRPVVINKFLVNYAQTVDNPSFTGALHEMFGDNVIGNTDILKNMLNNFSEVNIEGDIVTVKPNAIGKSYSEEEIYPSIDVNDKKVFFEHFGSYKFIIFDSNLPLQQIFYGAPGTGKSHSIDKDTNESNRIRTTFHPDYDYATFVGAYKPTAKSVDRYGLFGKDTVTMKHDDNTPIKEDVIVYKFIPQAFIKAYVEAWRRYADTKCTDKDFYLVIEEINRGNCAQIFGDLFQLLDRTNAGFSSYAVETESDLQDFLTKDEKYKLDIKLSEDIKNDTGKVIATAEKVMNGKVLVLPPNLHIWATMNTSDQSLFPIDSAFKRRWDWKYTPISDAGKGYYIDVNGHKYDWWSFLEKVNGIVEEMTSSEDKQLGYFFCKAEDGKITAEKFVGKVIFYLWNDVFKDYGFDRDEFKYEDEEGKTKSMTFRKFFNADGSINEVMAEKFLTNLKVEEANIPTNENETDEVFPKSHHDYIQSISFDDEVFSSDDLTKFEVFTKALQKIGLDRVVPIIEQSKYKRLGCPIASKKQYDAIIQSTPFSYVEIEGYQFVKGVADETYINILNEIKDALNLSFTIEIYN